MRKGAVIILFKRDGAVLMQHRDDKPGIAYPGFWGLPSGGVEGEEEFQHPELAAKRELEEETGYIADKLYFLFTSMQEIKTEKNGVVGERVVEKFVYLVEYDGEQEISCNEGKEMRFVKESELDPKKAFVDHVGFISRFREGLLDGSIEIRR